jgi:hypothetical protein
MCWLRQWASSENVDLIDEAKYYTFFHAAQNLFKKIFVLRHDSAAVTPSWTDTTWWSDNSLRPSNNLFIQITRECWKYFDLFNNWGEWDCEHNCKVNDTINLLFSNSNLWCGIDFRQFNYMINRIKIFFIFAEASEWQNAACDRNVSLAIESFSCSASSYTASAASMSFKILSTYSCLDIRAMIRELWNLVMQF